MKLPWSSDPPDFDSFLTDVISAIDAHEASAQKVPEASDAWEEHGAKTRELVHEVARDLRETREEVATLRIALAEGIEHEERRERRIKSVVQRARKQLQALDLEDGALEAESEDFPDDDGDGSEEDGVLALHEDLAPPQENTPSSVKGVSVEQLQRARGIGA